MSKCASCGSELPEGTITIETFSREMKQALIDNSWKDPLSRIEMMQALLNNLSDEQYIDAANYCFLLANK